ncbi:orotidine-5'-phosphate decarboxylase [Clostridium hydrogeniformans]|uniref:orotidine-5'-phosphate decarboxylase n=1 Tax=Clostridium hydrogeniformans TaxID=349933 RepID=UPI000ABFC463|nr:orotidine-5'-phosphate decarboxylase [Clostridium hydrogeniformans]
MDIIDKLYKAVEDKGVVCVGLDTSLNYIPEFFKGKFQNNVEEILFNFNKEIIDSTYDVAACFKVQIAYYEALGIDGLKAYSRTVKYLKEKDLISIGDIKRGDIADTAKQYAKAHFKGDFEVDFITLSPYMGLDSIEPYMPYLESGEKGAFALVRTSNKGAEDLQYVDTKNENKVFHMVGEKVNTMGKSALGSFGYSTLGAVVGCTHVDEAKEIREKMDSTFFLIPGYGAQGGKAEDVALYLKNGNGGVVNSSRKILLAYKRENREKEFALCAREEAIRMRDEIKRACDNLKA